MTRLDLATAEYIGARAQQQDLSAAIPLASGAMLVLADGLGGHESGAEAARIVVETFRASALAGAFDPAVSRRSALRETVERANQRIAEGADPAHGHRGMASTVVAAVLVADELSWVSVGDSHLYVWRDGRLAKLNDDHSQAGLMVRSGNYKATDPEVQAVKSVLVSALTGRKLEIVDLPQQSFGLLPGDVVILASDGLNTLDDPEIETIVAATRDKGSVHLSTVLLETVRDRRVERQDNTTVALARVLANPEPAAAAPEEPRTVAHDVSVPLRHDDDDARTERIGVAGPVSPRPAVPRESASVPDAGAAPHPEPTLQEAASPDALPAAAASADAASAPTERIAAPSPRSPAPRMAPRVRRSPDGAIERDLPPDAAAPRATLASSGRPTAARSRLPAMRMLLVLIVLLAALGALAFARPDLLDGWWRRADPRSTSSQAGGAPTAGSAVQVQAPAPLGAPATASGQPPDATQSPAPAMPAPVPQPAAVGGRVN